MGGPRLHFAAFGLYHFRGLFNLKAADVQIHRVPSENSWCPDESSLHAPGHARVLHQTESRQTPLGQLPTTGQRLGTNDFRSTAQTAQTWEVLPKYRDAANEKMPCWG